jgi:hypothetical protein
VQEREALHVGGASDESLFRLILAAAIHVTAVARATETPRKGAKIQPNATARRTTRPRARPARIHMQPIELACSHGT